MSYLDVKFENFTCSCCRQNIVHDELAISRQVVSFLVKFFNTRFILNFFVARRKHISFDKADEKFLLDLGGPILHHLNEAI